MEFHVIELPKPPAELKDNDDILLWDKFINAEKKEEFDMLSNRNKYIDNAYDHLNVMSQDEKMRMEYEAREKAVRDHNQMIWESEQRGEDRLAKLNNILIENGRLDDLKRASNDKDYRRKRACQVKCVSS